MATGISVYRCNSDGAVLLLPRAHSPQNHKVRRSAATLKRRAAQLGSPLSGDFSGAGIFFADFPIVHVGKPNCPAEEESFFVVLRSGKSSRAVCQT